MGERRRRAAVRVRAAVTIGHTSNRRNMPSPRQNSHGIAGDKARA